ncbi:MAG: GTPase Era [Pseudomonadota bacterium]
MTADLSENKSGGTTKCGLISVLGAPNAGKSTLVNRLVGAKVSIVTQKVQTTRARITGIVVQDQTQLVLIDTPGIFKPKRKLDRAMVGAAWDSLEGTDLALLIVDAEAELLERGIINSDRRSVAGARKAHEDTKAIINTLNDRSGPKFLILNKIDQAPREDLLALIAAISSEFQADETFLISAANGDGVQDLLQALVTRMPEGPWLYPDDQLSNISDRLMAAEVTREKIFLRLHQELPYESTVETEDWTRTKAGELRIDQTVYVSREGHKPIVLGKGGQTLKAIGEAARKELTEIYGEKVHLFLHVKVREGWAEENARLRALGLDV